MPSGGPVGMTLKLDYWARGDGLVRTLFPTLTNSVRPEIQMAVHQTARFSIKPMQSHELAIMRIGMYLCDNPEGGIIL
jgi:hypothetical protein